MPTPLQLSGRLKRRTSGLDRSQNAVSVLRDAGSERNQSSPASMGGEARMKSWAREQYPPGAAKAGPRHGLYGPKARSSWE